MRARVLAQLTEFERLGPRSATTMPQLGRALHLRTDLWLGVQAGGAVAHTAGIANAFAARGMAPVLAAFERNPILSAAVDERLLPLPDRFWDFPEMPAFFANTTLETSIEALLDEVRPALIYHRLAAFSFAGAQAARQRGLPMIVEYNGSEAWIARHWGRPFREEELALRIETAVLRAADRVVAVSAPLRDELIRKGVPDERIRMVMNGVNTGHFRSDIDATPQRLALGIDPEHVVMGFIGSFGVWHGVPVLVEAYARMLDQQPQLRRSTRLLLVGDGIERPKVEARIAALGLNDNVVMTGLVAQEKAPAMLAAADILVAPHVPNTDGSSFFGSPTKLFEYMSMGRCIVASQLDQIGDVLVDDRTALLAAPGEAHALADALIRAVGDPLLRSRLGGAARAVALAQHDWRVRLDEILR
ncbi:MAG: glycosyltransferase family 4 protein [Hyphomicrobiaceae bacterium]